jgi:hypothetical protein
MLKARKDTSFENQENIDTRRPRDDGSKPTKKPMRQTPSAMSHEQVRNTVEIFNNIPVCACFFVGHRLFTYLDNLANLTCYLFYVTKQRQLAAALDELKDKHRRLQQLRETDAERNLAECRAQLDETIRSAANYRAKIEPQLECRLSVQHVFWTILLIV